MAIVCLQNISKLHREAIRERASQMPKSRPEITTRKATVADASAIARCLQEAFEPYQDDYTEDAYRDTVPDARRVSERITKMCVFVAVDPANETVGTVACNVVSPVEGHIRGMAVCPQWHGAGVANALIGAVEFELQRRGCLQITLDATLPLGRAMHFYERHGFRRSGRTSDFFGMELLECVKALEG